MRKQDAHPEGDTSNLYCGKERRGVFCVSCSNATPPFEMKKSIFDKMPKNLFKVF